MDKIKNLIEEYQESILPTIEKYIKNKTILDAGCGNGINSVLFNKKYNSEMTLIDFQDIRDKEAHKFPFFKTSIEKTPFKTKTFEVVFLQYVLHHLPLKVNINDILIELKRVGKTIIIIEEIKTNKTNLKKAKEFDAKINDLIHPSTIMPIYKYYSDEELQILIKKANLKITEEKIIHNGCEEDGFLQKKIYILN